MPLFYVVWDAADGANSVVIDADSPKRAGERAALAYGEPAPSRVCLVPAGTFLGEVVEAEDGGLAVEPIDAVQDLFDRFEDDAPAILTCGNEADSDDGEVLVCDLPPGHAAPHKSEDGSVW